MALATRVIGRTPAGLHGIFGGARGSSVVAWPLLTDIRASFHTEKRKEVNTMMDLSSVVDAGLVVMGAMAVLLMGLWTLSAESSTVSISAPPVETVRQQVDMASLPKAA